MNVLEIGLSALVVASVCHGQGFDLSKFHREDLLQKQNRQVAVVNSGFEQGSQGWKVRGAGGIDPRGGRNGTAALKYVRTDPRSYKLVSQKFSLKSNRFYRFGAWVKTEDVRKVAGGGAGLCLEFSGPGKDGKRKYMSGFFLSGISGTKDWTLLSATKRVPPKADRASLTLYLWKGATGTAWYDDAFLVEQDTNLWTAYTLSAYNTPVDGKCTVALFYDNQSIMKRAAPGALRGQLHFPKLKKTFAVKIENDRAVFDLKGLPEGRHDAEFYCLDTARKVVLYSKAMPLTIRAKAGERRVALDRRGRTWVDGELFLPIGVFTAGLSRKDVDTLSDGGVNCVLPYSSMSLGFDRNERSIEQTREVLNYCSAKNVKVIFSGKDIGSNMRYAVKEWYGAKGQEAIIRKMVNAFKDHPALLAWYINDEQAISEIPRLTKMRQLYNRLDPDHPTYGLDYKFESLPMCGPTADVFGIDHYPVGKKAPYSLVENETGMKQLAKTSLPMWVVPQMMNMGTFYAKTRKECAANFRSPSEAEMRSMVLLEAICGAKGFIFYHYNYLKSWKLPRDNFQREWPKFCAVVKTLQELTPFILSEREARKVKLTAVAGQVRAREMTDNAGNRAVLIVALGPGEAKTIVSLPGQPKLKSKYGLTRHLGNGEYEFTASGINSDILSD
jgi:hypothetical protein